MLKKNQMYMELFLKEDIIKLMLAYVVINIPK